MAQPSGFQGEQKRILVKIEELFPCCEKLKNSAKPKVINRNYWSL